ncbi:unnamed protein product [Clonostachys rosea]|uniref:Zn(2)-C6 fungal-type domain-containing protein n=1 Tax=Bionectria ochroleuca TaxID=29856 RepID=A0ABY6UUX5_BIOOC|nr:unnamed protein product [Clonostachys rosea]
MPPPAKRPRRGNHRGAPDDNASHPPPEPPPNRGASNPRWTRASAACHACRARKTRCDNEQPTCGYCNKAGLECFYPDDGQGLLSLCQGVGPRLLDAIETLTDLIRQNEGRFSHAPQNWEGNATSETLCLEQPDGGDQQLNNDPTASESALVSKSSSSFVSDAVGLHSVLKWAIFPKPVPFMVNPVSSAARVVRSGPASLPSMEFSEMKRLANKFLTLAHPKNPIVDGHTLHLLIRQVSENGPDWSCSTCLVALVCALGALSTRHNASGEDAASPDEHDKMETDLAQQYWNVAEKRLSFAMAPTSNPWEGVQCVCLAGIWYMYHMEPLQAWKYFSFASHCWYTAYLEKSFDPQPLLESPTTEQSLYFTCYKSEWQVSIPELAFELSLPTSVLETIEYPYTFPSPPDLDQDGRDRESLASKQKSWYYYLAEIASRHLINRILQSQKKLQLGPTHEGIASMLHHVEVFESQLADWYSSLPACVSFDIPTVDAYPLADELIHLLRGRFMAIRELLCRPLIQLCTTYPLRVSADIMSRVENIVTRGLQYALFRVQATTSTQHHGSWFHVRTYVTCSLILLSAEQAILLPHLNGISGSALPAGWRESIIAKKESLGDVWGWESGGITECEKTLSWALAGFQVNEP